MEEEEQSRVTFEGARSKTSGVSSSSSHETGPSSNKYQGQENERFLASDSFCSRMCAMMSKADVEKLTDIQSETLTKFQSVNANLSQFNRYSFDQYEKLNIHFQNHTRMIVDMKKDLDIIFRRIRNLKTKLSKQYGSAFAVTSANIQKLEEEIEADNEDYKEEKPQTAQQGSTENDYTTTATSNNATFSNDIESPDQPQESSSSVLENATETQTNDNTREKQTVYQEGPIERPVLRPQLSSSDDNYDKESDQETSTDGKESYMDHTSKDSQENKELTAQKLTPKDSKGTPVYKTTLRPEISSSDESLEDETDDELEGESETNYGGYDDSSLTSEEESTVTQNPNDDAANIN